MWGRVWPGSHRPRRVYPHSSHSDPRFDTALLAEGHDHTEAEAVAVPMQLGDVLVFDGTPLPLNPTRLVPLPCFLLEQKIAFFQFSCFASR